MSFEIRTINKGTILNIDPEAYKMTVPLDAKYVLVPVINMYEIYKVAKENSILFLMLISENIWGQQVQLIKR